MRYTPKQSRMHATIGKYLIMKILHSKISVFMSFCITYKQALLKNLPSNESKVLIHEGSAL